MKLKAFLTSMSKAITETINDVDRVITALSNVSNVIEEDRQKAIVKQYYIDEQRKKEVSGCPK